MWSMFIPSIQKISKTIKNENPIELIAACNTYQIAAATGIDKQHYAKHNIPNQYTPGQKFKELFVIELLIPQEVSIFGIS